MASTLSKQKLNNWRKEISNARCENQFALFNQLKRLDKSVNGNNRGDVQRFEKKLNNSIELVNRLKESKLALNFPEQLPISQRKDEIAKLIQDNQIVIVAGETGSGKTTQLPKICLSLGYGNKGLIWPYSTTQDCRSNGC